MTPWLVAAGLTLALTGCAGARSPAGDGAETPSGDVLVLAAASLTDGFTELASQWQGIHQSVDVTLGFAGSNQLTAQILDGAPADVFAVADPEQMDVLAAAGRLDGATSVFATNALTIVVEPGNPHRISSLADLADPGLKVVLAAEQVPAGRYAREALGLAGVALHPVSLETDVRAVLSKVALGEADAGIVYGSDLVTAADRVDGVQIPARFNVAATYVIAVLADAPNPVAGRAFVDFVLSPAGQAALADQGFAVP